MREDQIIRKLLLTALGIGLLASSALACTSTSSLNLGNQASPGIAGGDGQSAPSTPPPPVGSPGDVAGNQSSGQASQEAHGPSKRAFIAGRVLLPSSSADLDCETNFSAAPVVNIFKKKLKDDSWVEDETMTVDECGHFDDIFGYIREVGTGNCAVAYKYVAQMTDKTTGANFTVESCPLECPVTGQNKPLQVLLQPPSPGSFFPTSLCSQPVIEPKK